MLCPCLGPFLKPKFRRFADVESEADRLHREVFSNEKGFLASAAYNPARAREKEEEEEAEKLASEWGSTPDKAKDVMQKTRGDKDLSFQVRLFSRYNIRVQCVQTSPMLLSCIFFVKCFNNRSSVSCELE